MNDAIRVLAEYHGTQPEVPPREIHDDPFALVLWEQVAYLATDSQRFGAFARLQQQVGLTPAAILGAAPAALEAACRAGGTIAVADRAERMRWSARRVIAKWGGDARAIFALPEGAARRELARFPMIGEPGADKILALAGIGSRVPLDSNALRVLVRLGFVAAGRDYRATYRAAQTTLLSQPSRAEDRVQAGALLRRHGQELCRRSAPRCPGCPLASRCDWYGASAIPSG